MVKFNGISTASYKMNLTQLLKRFLFGRPSFDIIVEGLYAHQYTDENARRIITEKYKERHAPVVNPLTAPENYDPLNPPTGWVYDPYYEIWMEINE